MSESGDKGTDTIASALVLGSVFVIAICGLVYELIAGTLSSYLLGDSTTQFSLTIGLFLTSMGVGSFFSRFFLRNLLFWFIAIEIAIGVIGGTSALAGFAAFAFTQSYIPILASFVFAVGALVGLEIPLVIRLLREVKSLRITVANVFSVDYAGALFASLVFPFVLLPHLGLVRSALVVGIANILVAALLLFNLRSQLKSGRRVLAIAVLGAFVGLTATAIVAGGVVQGFENRVYQDDVIYSRTSQYQEIIVTRWHRDIRLYLNGHLQFSSVDEYRYHEALALPALAATESRENVLILGGGDGLLAHQVLKYKDVKTVTIVDLDSVVTDLFTETKMLRELNQGSLHDERVNVQNRDAMEFLAESNQTYDVILIDLPDPSESALAKLYSEAFYRLCLKHLSAGGVLATQATSPFRSKEAFWCIESTLAAVHQGPPSAAQVFYTRPYHAYIPTFGTWGFVLASRRAIDPTALEIKVPTKFLTQEMLGSLFVFPKDLAKIEVPVNQLNAPVLSRLYRKGYHKYLD